MIKKSAALTALLLVLTAGMVFSQTTVKAIKGGTLINTNGEPPLYNSVVIIEEDSITVVGTADSVSIPDEAEVIDASGKWVIPGLIDSHVHFFQSGGLYTRPDVIDLTKFVTYPEELERIKNTLDDTFKRYLRSGITSVVDAGGPFWNFKVRERAYNNPDAPRVAVAGPLISTYQPPELTTDDPPIIEVKTPEAARELVRRQVKENTDLIKIWYIVQQNETPEDHLPIIEATIDESHKHNTRVAVHATQLATAKAAVKAGADILVHSVTDERVDEEFIRMLKENEVIYTTTLTVFESYPEVLTQQVDLLEKELDIGNPQIVSSLFDLEEIPEVELPKQFVKGMKNPASATTDSTALENLDILQEAGVTIAAGTDAGNIGTLHGPSLFREFQLMSSAGLNSYEILKAATINNARLMGNADRIGTIEEGKLADLLILNSDPLEEILNTGDLHMVIKGGTIHQADSILDKSPEDIVQQQVNAYNAKNIEAFLDTYSFNIEIYHHPDSLSLSGIPEMRNLYGKIFKNAPDLHAEIVNRITYGNYVVDRERVTGLPNGSTIEGLAIYRVQNGKIERVWFIFD